MDQISIPITPTHQTAGTQTAALKEAAIQLEATFFAEMLKSAGMGETSQSFGGGNGEDQFGSFLLQAQATEIARAGGIGLAETFFDALLERQNDQN